jgi:glyoxylase-like metal-dependent hydrolase (beta-lactamase superfamily II)
VLVDTGWPGETAWDGLVAGVAAAGRDITEIKAVLVTHFHADHSGLAGRVREVSGAWIGMHELDAAALRRYKSLAEFVTASAGWLERRGVPAAETTEMLTMGEDRMRGLDKPDVLIEDGTRPFGGHGRSSRSWAPKTAAPPSMSRPASPGRGRGSRTAASSAGPRSARPTPTSSTCNGAG